MIRLVFLSCGLAALLIGQAAEDEANWLQSSQYDDVARWMIDQPDPEMRAAGLAALAQSGDSEAMIEPAQFMAEVDSLLQDNPTGAAVSMIARGCRQIDLLEECAEAGVLDAINRLDGGNPLAAGFFHDPDSPEFRHALVSAKRIDDHYAEEVSAWFEALQARKPDKMEEGMELSAAIGIAMASVVRLNAVVTRCKSAVATDEALDRACQRLSEQMRDSTQTLILRNIGFGMARARAKAMGHHELVDALKKEREALFARQMCLGQAAEPGLIDGAETLTTRFLEVFSEHGELAAFEFVAGDAAADCPAA